MLRWEVSSALLMTLVLVHSLGSMRQSLAISQTGSLQSFNLTFVTAETRSLSWVRRVVLACNLHTCTASMMLTAPACQAMQVAGHHGPFSSSTLITEPLRMAHHGYYAGTTADWICIQCFCCKLCCFAAPTDCFAWQLIHKPLLICLSSLCTVELQHE